MSETKITKADQLRAMREQKYDAEQARQRAFSPQKKKPKAKNRNGLRNPKRR
jgi:hypothetical protein